jgi:hypothetical protein
MPVHEPEFKPIALVGENLEIQKGADAILGYYKIKYIEPLQGVICNFGTLDAEAESGDTEFTDLYMNDLNLAQYRLYCLSDIEVTLRQPKAKTRFTGKTYVHKVDAFTHQRDPTLKTTEIFMWEDEKVYFNAKNVSKKSQPLNRFVAFGYKFVVEKLAAKPEKYATITVEGA